MNPLSAGSQRTVDIGGYQYSSYIQAWDTGSTFSPLLLNPRGGNVGIGTNSPSYPLHVSGNAYASNFIVPPYGQLLPSNTTTGLSVCGQSAGYPNGGCINYRGANGGAGGTAENGLEFVAGGSERMRILANGNVGIGKTTPSYQLDISGGIRTTSNGGIALAIDASNAAIRDLTNGASTLHFDVSSGGSTHGAFNFRSSNSFDSRMYIATNGNVGIGTTSPNSPLHVSKPHIASFTGTTTGAITLDGTYTNGHFNAIDFAHNDSAPFARIAAQHTGSGTYLGFGTSNNYGSGVTNQAMTIDPSGNVGIGTTSPPSKLTIEGGITEIRSGGYLMLRPTANDWDFRLQSIPGNKLGIFSGGDLGNPVATFVNGGNVGIGTTSPATKLDVFGVVRAAGTNLGTVSLWPGNASLPGYINWSTPEGTRRGYLGWANGASLAFVTENGWGVDYLLSGDFRIFNDSGAAHMHIESTNGNVGIGTTNPLSKLTVSGPNGIVAAEGTDYPSLYIVNTSKASGSFGRTWAWMNYGTGLYLNTYASTAASHSPGGPILSMFASDSTGNIGIGNATPGSNKLYVTHNNSGAAIYGYNSGANYGVQAYSASSYGLQAASGTNYGIMGQTSSTGYGGIIGYSQDALTYGILGHANAYGVYGYHNSAIAGGVGVYARSTKANGYGFLGYNDSAAYYCYIGYGNSYSIACSGPTSGVSDERLKKNIVPLSDSEGLDALMKIQPVHYYWKDEKRKKREIGFLAQDVEEVLPELVGRLEQSDPNDPKSLKDVRALQYDRLAAPIVKAIQELKSLFDGHDDRIVELEAAKADLTKRLSTLEQTHARTTADLEARIETLTKRLEAIEEAR
ncbi:MAG: hypothetical protein EBS23_01855 [Betaproteobacteria bacterium]|nr:hypothetical protein [Betaproteobacteria bacterium]